MNDSQHVAPSGAACFAPINVEDVDGVEYCGRCHWAVVAHAAPRSSPVAPSGAETLRQRLKQAADACADENGFVVAQVFINATWHLIADALAVAAREPQGWRPMESAPKDGTELLLFASLAPEMPQGRIIGKWFDFGSMGGWWTFAMLRVYSSKWMPLPAPPVDPTGTETR